MEQGAWTGRTYVSRLHIAMVKGGVGRRRFVRGELVERAWGISWMDYGRGL